MNALILRKKLDEVRQQLRTLYRRRAIVKFLCAAAALAVLLAWAGPACHWSARTTTAVFVVFVIGAAAHVLRATRRQRWSDLELARMIEEKHRDLDALLLTAVGRLEDEEEGNFFTERLLEDAVDCGVREHWARQIAAPALRQMKWLLAIASLICLTAALFMLSAVRHGRHAAELGRRQASSAAAGRTVTVSPGDAEIEQGSRLIVEARFANDVPGDATLVVMEPAGTERERIPMRLTVDQQVFGGLIVRVDKDSAYRVEFGPQHSEDYRITTYQLPALEHADVRITPPAYAKLPVKEIKNTLRVTALEGSELAFQFKLNKAVARAELSAPDGTTLALAPMASDASVVTGALQAEKSQKWKLHLTDAKGRTGKNPAEISILVQSNQLAKVELVFPKRDLEVSSLQELPVEAKIWDDVSVVRSGAVFNIAGRMKEVAFNHVPTAPAKKVEVSAALMLEQEKVNPRQLVSYYVWAEDVGPQGEVRRAMSDMFFAEVRYFEDFFREGEAPPGDGPQSKGQADKLVELQKQVVNATWRLIRSSREGRAPAATADIKVVQQSQEIVLGQTKEAMEKATDQEVKNALTEAWKSMRDALMPLAQSVTEEKATPLPQALAFEQSALEWLHRAQGREHVVMRTNKPSQGAGKQANERQLMNLEMKQKDQRYEEEKKATAEQTMEQEENLQVLNRLKELARRQEALAEKMKELKNELAKASTPDARNELDNQLKHLQDEQEQLLRDLDDLKERMEKPENAANMAQTKEQLEKTREKVLDSAQQLQQQKLADAANSATRAQRDLEKMQADLKQKTAKRFSEEMKQLRAEARMTAEREKAIGEAMENQKTPANGNDTSAALQKMLNGSQVARQIDEQAAKVKELLEEMRRISEQAEGNNPLLHRSLYEAVRQAKIGGLEENLKQAHDEARRGRRADAQEAEHRASLLVDDLKKEVEKAAEGVLGSEAEALQLAKAELDKLIQEARKEDHPAGAEMKEPAAASSPPNKPSDPKAAQAGTPAAPPADAAATATPATNPDAEARDDKARVGNRQKLTADANPTTSGADRPGSTPGNPGKSKDQFPTSGPSPKAGARDGGGLAQNKPGEGMPQPPGDGIKDPKDLAKNPGQTPVPEQNTRPQPKSQAQITLPANVPAEGAAPKSSTPSEQASSDANGWKPGGSEDSAGSAAGDHGTKGEKSKPQGTAANSSSASGRDAKNNPPNTAKANGGTGAAKGAKTFFFEAAAEQTSDAPITGGGYGPWSDRLRNVEELLSQPALRNEAARVLDDARALRIEHERENKVPQADHLQLRIIGPLVELRDRVAEELARLDTGNPTVPVDRDPVPPVFRELVRRYYTELGAGK